MRKPSREIAVNAWFSDIQHDAYDAYWGLRYDIADMEERHIQANAAAREAGQVPDYAAQDAERLAFLDRITAAEVAYKAAFPEPKSTDDWFADAFEREDKRPEEPKITNPINGPMPGDWMP